MSVCTATYAESFRYSDFAKAMPPMPCHKPVDEQGRHRGEHETFLPNPAPVPSSFDPADKVYKPFVRLVHWYSGGASLMSYDPSVPNQNCICQTNDRIGHQPSDHRWTTCANCASIMDAKRDGPVNCPTCGIWLDRAEEFTDYLRTHDSDNLYSFNAGHPGGFGGRRFTITMDDGTVVAKDRAGLWSAGRAPWWIEEKFPPNCTIEPGSGTDRVPGYTTGPDGHGEPLTYTGGPSPA